MSWLGSRFILTILILFSCYSGAEESLTFVPDSHTETGRVTAVTSGAGFPDQGEIPRGQVIVTTDQPEVLRRIPHMFGMGDSIVVIPYGSDLVSGFNESPLGKLLASGKRNTIHNFKEDTVGFVIATFGLGAEAFTWYHMTNLSTLSLTGNIFFSLIFTLRYGYNKKNWATDTTPLRDGIRRLFNESGTWMKGGAKDLAIVFTSSLIYGTSWYLGRSLLFPPDRLLDLSLQVSSLTMPILIGISATFANFSWSQGIRHVDEKIHSGAASVGRLMMNLKGIVLSIFATSAALMNPNVFGYGGWAALIGSGISGMWFYRNFHKHYQWADPAGESIQEFLKKLAPRVYGAAPIQCMSLF
jgi:hypothetical protein